MLKSITRPSTGTGNQTTVWKGGSMEVWLPLPASHYLLTQLVRVSQSELERSDCICPKLLGNFRRKLCMQRLSESKIQERTAYMRLTNTAGRFGRIENKLDPIQFCTPRNDV